MSKISELIFIFKWYFGKYNKPLSKERYEIICKLLKLDIAEEEDFETKKERNLMISFMGHFEHNTKITQKEFNNYRVLEEL